jgi:hypothetical protein
MVLEGYHMLSHSPNPTNTAHKNYSTESACPKMPLRSFKLIYSTNSSPNIEKIGKLIMGNC